MKVQESFVIAEPPERLWAFFERVDQVARCVPGVEAVEVVDDENSRIRVTQAVGPMTATFDLRMRITERTPHELMRFTAIGRAVKGAAGNVRTTNTVRLAEIEEGTLVELESDLAMGGVLGSLGQKVVAKQAGQVTRAFSDALQRAIRGEGEEGASAGPTRTPAAAAPEVHPTAPEAQRTAPEAQRTAPEAQRTAPEAHPTAPATHPTAPRAHPPASAAAGNEPLRRIGIAAVIAAAALLASRVVARLRKR